MTSDLPVGGAARRFTAGCYPAISIRPTNFCVPRSKIAPEANADTKWFLLCLLPSGTPLNRCRTPGDFTR